MAIPEISVDELLLLKAAGEVRLVDVREDDEGRSYRACEFAAAQGKNVVNVAGGMMAWWAAGHNTVSGR